MLPHLGNYHPFYYFRHYIKHLKWNMVDWCDKIPQIHSKWGSITHFEGFGSSPGIHKKIPELSFGKGKHEGAD